MICPSLPYDQWAKETGFANSLECLSFTHSQYKKANQKLAEYPVDIDLVIVDACTPERYQQGSRLLITNNWVEPKTLDCDRYEQFANSWYGCYAGAVKIESVVPERKFNCFINRMDPIRQSWLYQLIRRGIFDKGLVSFNMEIRRHVLMGHCDPTATAEQVFQQQFQQHLQIFSTEHEFAKTIVPYRNFDYDLTTAIMRTEFSLVLETYFDQNNIITFSEKIFRCLKLPRPWVMFAMKNAVAYLKDMGFDVLDDLVDHSYDKIDFAIERQVAILDQCQIMCKRELTDNDIKRCEQAAIHNQSLLDKLFKTFHTDVNISCQNIIKKCLT